ncbi:MAG: hypothetical protein JXR51_10915 [Bacteroidales bacterium]|nr:hypothetical protein [Bacteroidales bacterium]MBN2757679.1 hypothetical protein [Bacteroidales bacterium]
MKSVTILGHCNVALSIILDILYEKYNNAIRIEIVSNIKQEENKDRNIPYLNKLEFINELFHADWNYNADNKVYIAANGKETRIKIFDFFYKHYKMDY